MSDPLSASDGVKAVPLVSRKGTLEDNVWNGNDEASRLLEKLRASKSTQPSWGEKMYATSIMAFSWAGTGFDSGMNMVVGI